MVLFVIFFVLNLNYVNVSTHRYSLETDIMKYTCTCMCQECGHEIDLAVISSLEN